MYIRVNVCTLDKSVYTDMAKTDTKVAADTPININDQISPISSPQRKTHHQWSLLLSLLIGIGTSLALPTSHLYHLIFFLTNCMCYLYKN